MISATFDMGPLDPVFARDDDNLPAGRQAPRLCLDATARGRDKDPCIPLPCESLLNLTTEQVAAAEAAGCQFIPAPPDGLHRYAMQRKLFRFGGQDVLATCGGGLYETASTLDRLIAVGRASLPAAVAEPAALVVEAVRSPEPQPETVAEPPDATAVAEQASVGPEPEAKPAPRRRARAPRAAPPVIDAAPDAPVEMQAPPEVGMDPTAGSRARKPAAASRWATAGAERRGRTDQHWSKRVR